MDAGRSIRRALPRVVQPGIGRDLTSSNNEIDRGFDGADHARLGGAVSRIARIRDALSSRRRWTSTPWPGCRTTVESCGAALVLAGVASAIDAAKRSATGGVQQSRCSSSSRRGIASSTRGRWCRCTRRSRTRCGGARSWTKWASRCSLKFYEWAGGGAAGRAVHAIIDDRQSRWFDDIATVEKRETRDDIYLLAARDADGTSCRRSSDGDGGRGVGPRARDRLRAPARQHRFRGASWFFSRGPVPVDGRRHDGDAGQLEPARGRFAAWEHRRGGRCSTSGEWDQARVVLPDRPDRASDEPALFRPERTVADGPVPHASPSPELPCWPHRPIDCCWCPRG